MKELLSSKVQINGYKLRKIGSDGFSSINALKQALRNNITTYLPTTEDEYNVFVQNLRYGIWSLPMVVWQFETVIGFVYTSGSDTGNLSTNLTAIFKEPRLAALPLAMYIRHLFWNFPLRRIATRCVVMPETEDYLDLYRKAGMQEEGIIENHARIKTVRYDVAYFAVLRDDFKKWCRENLRIEL